MQPGQQTYQRYRYAEPAGRVYVRATGSRLLCRDDSGGGYWALYAAYGYVIPPITEIRWWFSGTRIKRSVIGSQPFANLRSIKKKSKNYPRPQLRHSL